MRDGDLGVILSSVWLRYQPPDWPTVYYIGSQPNPQKRRKGPSHYKDHHQSSLLAVTVKSAFIWSSGYPLVRVCLWFCIPTPAYLFFTSIVGLYWNAKPEVKTRNLQITIIDIPAPAADLIKWPVTSTHCLPLMMSVRCLLRRGWIKMPPWR